MGHHDGTAPAILLRDRILDEPNTWAATFDARRADLVLPGPAVIKQNLHVAKTWLNYRVLGPGHGSLER